MNRFSSILVWSSILGAVLWVGGIAVLRPVPLDFLWARALLLFAPLVLVPLGLRHMPFLRDSFRPLLNLILLPAALLLSVANLLDAGWLAAALALPWLAFANFLAGFAMFTLWRQGNRDLTTFCQAMSLIFLAIGAGWALLDRAGIRPLEFEPVIVLLTAIHFHYAGFVLTLIVSLCLAEHRQLAGVAAWGVLLGVPLVAAGITGTQLGLWPAFESVAGVFLAASGVLAGIIHLDVGIRTTRSTFSRLVFTLIGVSLLFSMTLAILYAVRFYWPIGWLDIPWMRALHGTANVFGFALPALLVRRDPALSP